MFLSIIIPLYNCEKYICRCLDSIYRQGLEEDVFEVIVVNDGSTDSGPDLVNKYGITHPNLRIINQTNAGVGCARNHGMEEAKGNYLMFVDADDWLISNGINTLKEYVDRYSDADMFVFLAHTVDHKYDFEKGEVINTHRLTDQTTFKIWGEEHGFGWNVWGRLISSNFIKKYNLRFTNHKVGEDLLFMTNMFTQGPEAKIIVTNLNIYRYFVNKQSALNKIDCDYNLEVCHGYIEIYQLIKSISTLNTYSQKVYDLSLNDCRFKVFTRMISGVNNYSKLIQLHARISENEILPIPNPISRIHQFVNITFKHPHILYLVSKLYQKIFLPYIKPHLSRN